MVDAPQLAVGITSRSARTPRDSQQRVRLPECDASAENSRVPEDNDDSEELPAIRGDSEFGLDCGNA